MKVYKICFYVPTSHLEEVKNNMFAHGAGKIGDYQCCAWQVLGEGQFMPLSGSNPFIGEENKIAKVLEYKVEMICLEQHLSAVIQALKASHPYEEPAFHIIALENIIS